MSIIKVNKKDYISPSQINSFIERRDQYIRNYVFGEPWGGNSSFSRGNAVEFGLNLVVDGMSPQEAASKAWPEYLRDCEQNNLSSEEVAKISKEDIVNSVISAGEYFLDTLKIRSRDTEKQSKVVYSDSNLPKNIIGYLDYKLGSALFSGSSIIDLKTAAKTPSKLSPGYKLQGTVYHLATGLPVSFCYVVSLKKGATVTVIPITQEDIAEYKPIIFAAAKAIDAFWSIVPDEIDDDYIDAFNALAFPNIHGAWNADERISLINSAVNTWLK